MQDNGVDNSNEIGYNVGNGSDVEIARMDERAPINDLECTHETLIPAPEDTIGDAVYHGCSNAKCGRGWYISK